MCKINTNVETYIISNAYLCGTAKKEATASKRTGAPETVVSICF